MKKSIITVAIILFVSIQTQAQWFNRIKGNGILKTEHRSLKNYDKITVSGPFNVALVYGEEGDISIKMEENLLEYLVTEVKGDKLIIRWKKKVNISTRRGIHIIVPFKDINTIILTGSGDVICKDLIKTNNFNTLLTGSGDIIANIEADSIKAKVTGSGNIELLGESHSLDVLVTGSGGFQSYKMIAETANTRVTGSGDIGLFVSQDITAKVFGSGDIVYRGHPKNQDTKVFGSGDIIEK